MYNISTQQLLEKNQQLEEENQQLKSREIEVSDFTETIMEDAQKDIHKLIDENVGLKRKINSDSDKLIILEKIINYIPKIESNKGYSRTSLIKELIINYEYSIDILIDVIQKLGYRVENEDNWGILNMLKNDAHEMDENDFLEEMTKCSNYLPENFETFSMNQIIDYIWKNKNTYRNIWIRMCDDIIDWVKINNKVYYITI